MGLKGRSPFKLPLLIGRGRFSVKRGYAPLKLPSLIPSPSDRGFAPV